MPTMEYVDVSESAAKTGFGIYGCPVGIDVRVWSECVRWTEEDNETQTYQEEKARLWEILYIGGAKLKMYPNEILSKECVAFQIHCIPRNGNSTEAVHVDLKIEPLQIGGMPGLIVRYLNVISVEIEPTKPGDLGLVG